MLKRIAATLTTAALTTTSIAVAIAPSASAASATTASPTTGTPCVLAAAGDVAGAEDFRTGAAGTAALITAADPERVLALGDLAYNDGTVSQFAEYYQPTWGAFTGRTEAVPGNHEARSGDAGIVSQFGPSAVLNRGIDVCGWRVILLNQYKGIAAAAAYLREDAARHPGVPKAVVWHGPRYSSGQHGNSTTVQPLWDAATAAGVRIVLNGHDHDYERFAPMDRAGAPVPTGTRQFVSGLGGHAPRPFSTVRAHSEVRFTGQPAVLFLTLSSDGSYAWSFESVDGTVRDAGSQPAVQGETVVASALDQGKALLAGIAAGSASAPGGSSDKSHQIARLHALATTPLTGERVPGAQLTHVEGLLTEIARQSASSPGGSSDKTAQIARLHALATTPLLDAQLVQAKELLADIALQSAAAPGGSADKTAQIARLHALATTPLTGDATPSPELTKAVELLSEIARQSASAPGGSSDKTRQIARLHALAVTPLS